MEKCLYIAGCRGAFRAGNRCRGKQGNRTSFEKVETPEQMLDLGEEGLKSYINSINLYPTKAKRIIAPSKILIDQYHSEVPHDRTALESLPGSGGKQPMLC